MKKITAVLLETLEEVTSESTKMLHEAALVLGISGDSVHVLKNRYTATGIFHRVGLPVPMLLWCPQCGERDVDKGEFAVKDHHTHACQHCGHMWRPAIVATVGVQFLPGFKDEEKP